MIPKIVHQTARSRILSSEENRLRRRSGRELPGWQFILWDDADNERLVAESFPQYLAKFNAIRRGVVKADICRCMYVAKMGGFYIDTDYVFLRSVPESYLNAECVLPISREGLPDDAGFRLGNAVFGAVPGFPFWSDFIDHLFTQPLQDLAEDEVEKITGPEGLTRFYLANRAAYPSIVLAPRPLFHPEIRRLGWGIDLGSKPVGAHLCWGSWRNKGAIGLVHAAARKLYFLSPASRRHSA